MTDYRLRFFALSPRRLPPSLRNGGGSPPPIGGPKERKLGGRDDGPRSAPRSRASLTFIARPCRSRPFRVDTARRASSSVVTSTNPNPRDLPVIRSRTIEADEHDPASANALRRSSSETSKERFPTNSLVPILAPSARLNIQRRTAARASVCTERLLWKSNCTTGTSSTKARSRSRDAGHRDGHAAYSLSRRSKRSHQSPPRRKQERPRRGRVWPRSRVASPLLALAS